MAVPAVVLDEPTSAVHFRSRFEGTDRSRVVVTQPCSCLPQFQLDEPKRPDGKRDVKQDPAESVNSTTSVTRIAALAVVCLADQ